MGNHLRHGFGRAGTLHPRPANQFLPNRGGGIGSGPTRLSHTLILYILDIFPIETFNSLNVYISKIQAHLIL